MGEGREGGRVVQRNSLGGDDTGKSGTGGKYRRVCSGNSSNDAFPKINFAR